MRAIDKCGAGDKRALQQVQRGTDTRIPVAFVKQPTGDPLDPATLEGLAVKVENEGGALSAEPSYTLEGGQLIVEVTKEISESLGVGVYTLKATGRIADPSYEDGYHDYTIITELCRVVRDAVLYTPTTVTANVLAGLKGKDGLNNYQIAVKHGYQGTEEQFAKDIIPKSNYERAKELQGFEGTEEEYLDSLKGEDGKDAYQVYLETTTDNPKLTKAQYAVLNATTTQYLYRINKGKDAPMNEQTLSADQLMELDSHRRNIINALRAKGAQVSDDDGLEALEAKIAALSYSKITIIREQQFSGWVDDVYPPMEVSETFRPVSLKNMFAQNPLLSQLPVVEGIEKALYLDSYAQRCPSLRSVELPDLREVKTATTMFDGCTSMTKATIGALPNLANATWLFSTCQSLVSATVGSAPKLEVAQGLFNNCTSLQSVTLDLSGGLVINASLLFNGCDKLRVVTGEIDLSRAENVNSAFSGCASLEEVRIKGIKVDLDLSACANLSTESVKSLVENLQQVTGKSIILARAWQTAHPTEARAYAQIATAKGFALTFR